MNSSEKTCDKLFGFSALPCSGEWDQQFLFLSPQHEAILADLVHCVSTRQGVALLEGPQGVGKTVLAHALVHKVPPNFRPLIIDNPKAEPLALMISLTQAMSIPIQEGYLGLINCLVNALQEGARRGSFYLVVIDDAQELTDQHLEEIWLLSQLERQSQVLLPFVLVATPALSQRLESNANVHLARLLGKKVSMAALTPQETLRYIDHRLQQVGSSFLDCFAADCSSKLFELTGGKPGRINPVCHQALERCLRENCMVITRAMLERKEKPIVPPQIVLPAPVLPLRRRFRKIMGALAGVALLAGLAVAVCLMSVSAKMPFWEPKFPGLASFNLFSAPAQRPMSPDPARSPELKKIKRLASPPSEPLAAPKQPTAPEPDRTQPSPSPAPVPPVAETKWSSAISHKVSSKDWSLLKIVAAHYPDNETGYVAVILANPKIIQESLIYRGQLLLLPSINQDTGMIKLSDNRYYSFYNSYNNVAQLKEVQSQLKELQFPYLVRETQQPIAGKLYRVYLGGYEHEEDLTEALKVLEKQ
jgi:type II secretory pathway predicted ATPase ExeA